MTAQKSIRNSGSASVCAHLSENMRRSIIQCNNHISPRQSDGTGLSHGRPETNDAFPSVLHLHCIQNICVTLHWVNVIETQPRCTRVSKNGESISLCLQFTALRETLGIIWHLQAHFTHLVTQLLFLKQKFTPKNWKTLQFQPHFVPNLYDFSSYVEDKRRNLVQLALVHAITVNGWIMKIKTLWKSP